MFYLYSCMNMCKINVLLHSKVTIYLYQKNKKNKKNKVTKYQCFTCMNMCKINLKAVHWGLPLVES